MSRTTLKDVARRAGVSYQTVSKVLNGRAHVSSETEARIWEAVEALNYRTNVTARNLRRQASTMLGFALPHGDPDAYHPILDRFLISITFAAQNAGYNLLSFTVPANDIYAQEPYQRLYARNQVAGFVLTNTNYNDPRIHTLMERNIPFCAFGRANPEWDFCWVDVDGRAGMRAAAEHLLQRGHRRVGLLTWPAGSQTGQERESGYRDALQGAGIAIEPAWIVRGENSARRGNAGMQQLLALPAHRRPTAVMCVSDLIAIGAIQATHDAGLRVGNDVAITGFDDVPTAQYMYPSLTSVAQPIAEAGEQVVDLLLRLIEEKPIDQKGILLQPRLVIRNSS